MDLKLEQGVTVKDRFGRETQISILTSNGKPVAVLHSVANAARYSDDRLSEEHVIQAINVTLPEEGKAWGGIDMQSVSAPSRSALQLNFEPAVEDVVRLAQADYEEDQGFAFLKYGEKGEELPENPSDAFMSGVKRAQARTGRKIRSRKLVGEPSSW